MKPVKIGTAELYLGDCRDVFPHVGCVNHVIGDPPYEAVVHASKARGRKIRTDGGPTLKPLRFGPIDAIRAEVSETMVESCLGWLIMFCTPEGVAPWRDAIEAAGARYKRACAWVKPDAAPQFNGQGPGMAVENFVTAWCGKGVSKWNGGGRNNVFTHLTNQASRDGRHETEKPVSLMDEIVRLFTNPGETVLDPFMGSGTTGIACLRRGSRFIGIEADPTSFDIAVERLAAADRQGELFLPGVAPGEGAGRPSAASG